MKEEITLNQILKMLLAHIKLIVIVTIIFGIVAYINSAYFTTPKYSTSMLLYVINANELPGETELETDPITGKSGSSDIAISVAITEVCQTLFKSDVMMKNMSELVEETVDPAMINSSMAIVARPDTQFLDVYITTTDPKIADEIASVVGEAAQETFEVFYPYGKITVVNNPYPAGQSSPNTRNDAVVGAGIGFALALVAAIILETINTKVKPGDDLYKIYNVPVFATIPDSDADKKTRKSNNAKTTENKKA